MPASSFWIGIGEAENGKPIGRAAAATLSFKRLLAFSLEGRIQPLIPRVELGSYVDFTSNLVVQCTGAACAPPTRALPPTSDQAYSAMEHSWLSGSPKGLTRSSSMGRQTAQPRKAP